MTPLSDALQASQSAALAALARSYVRGPLGASEDATEALAASLLPLGLTDELEAAQWIACLTVLRELGGEPPKANGQRPYSERRETEQATEAQWSLIRRMADDKGVTAPDGPLTRPQASQVIDELRDGSYSPDKWSVPF